MKKKNEFLKEMPELHRRQLIKALGGIMASPLVPSSFSLGLAGLLGDEALAQTDGGPTYFLEVNLRDQWDMVCAFVAPSIAQNWSNLSRDGGNGVTVFKQPQKIGNHYVTEEGASLKDHLDSIAVIETGDPHYGEIHGHEAACVLRSPGRSKTGGAGRTDMGTFDKRPNDEVQNGNVTLYSSTPTPAVLHNYHSMKNDTSIGKGINLRSSVRVGTHTFYHHSGSLGDIAQINRFATEEDFLKSFDVHASTSTTDVLSLYSKEIVGMMKRLDTKFLKDIQLNSTGSDSHLAALALAAKKQSIKVTSSSLKLTSDENDYWTSGIPGQFRCSNEEDVNSCVEQKGTINMGSMFAYVAKLFKSGSYRTIAIDYDFWDIHAPRDEKMLSNQGKQMAFPLARLIKELKDAGIYKRTVIALYTLDGSRSPRRNSTGELTKNSIVLAGEGINGGYYGDIKLSGDKDIYYRPDDKGKPISDGDTIPADGSYPEKLDKLKRVPAKDIYRTVAKAMGIPDSELNSLPDVKDGKPLSYLLKS